MVKKKVIHLSIAKDGSVAIDVQNASGSECLLWTKDVEAALSSHDPERHLKSQFYEEAQQVVEES
jgi:hypothetical protein